MLYNQQTICKLHFLDYPILTSTKPILIRTSLALRKAIAEAGSWNTVAISWGQPIITLPIASWTCCRWDGEREGTGKKGG
jgi:hypothetical protein